MKSDKSFAEFLRSGNRKSLWALIFLFGVILIILGGVFSSDGEENLGEAGLEEQIAEICSATEGVGECRVMITYSEGKDEVYAVAVLCEGAESTATRAKIVELVGSLFGIGANRITVLKISK